MAVAHFEEQPFLGNREFVRCAVASRMLNKGKRTIVYHDVFAKEILRRRVTARKQSPQTLSAHFCPLTLKAADWSVRMLESRLGDGALNPKPIAHGRNFTKRDTCLNHAERTRVHAEKHNALVATREL